MPKQKMPNTPLGEEVYLSWDTPRPRCVCMERVSSMTGESGVFILGHTQAQLCLHGESLLHDWGKWCIYPGTHPGPVVSAWRESPQWLGEEVYLSWDTPRPRCVCMERVSSVTGGRGVFILGHTQAQVCLHGESLLSGWGKRCIYPGTHPGPGVSAWRESPQWLGEEVYLSWDTPRPRCVCMERVSSVAGGRGVFILGHTQAQVCLHGESLLSGWGKRCIYPGTHPGPGVSAWRESPQWLGEEVYLSWDTPRPRCVCMERVSSVTGGRGVFILGHTQAQVCLHGESLLSGWGKRCIYPGTHPGPGVSAWRESPQ
ncbi:uncharacterized protein LOC127916651 [Oncorhynchus keta]|uniref:uncharacterized protein LOC127916651 n=1 Tax=Oncorhynchus keta TaxID=8018 RepID=UPI00227BBA7F|nr:uncharacterized protein LOC127916651 [Oncorhynchus keta]XP_052354979.1 uncharacterized protein LOC127916651 [Oncorhynchus keta]XP_052354990.1 uncharacterized protein LOC127916651 [Oncorhynchus keta]